ncbi:hypothetical protein [Bacillus cereus group sp. BfR-BA-01315]|uniref:hypothetical protein n=1 Tax=Bacillus cereus group sp. BfR-BA-01315 TaxID=2920292 RepID=UPI001F580A2B|nr:hypothetical protein [Bacillus cereus group sp. BfR-BA-01315]
MKKINSFLPFLCLLFTIISFIFLLTGNVGENEFLLLGIVQLGVLGTVFLGIKSAQTKLQKIIIWVLPLFSLSFLCFLITKII